MTTLPAKTEAKLGLVIDLDTCVGCHACAVSCKEWNTGGTPHLCLTLIHMEMTQTVFGLTASTRLRQVKAPPAGRYIFHDHVCIVTMLPALQVAPQGPPTKGRRTV